MLEPGPRGDYVLMVGPGHPPVTRKRHVALGKTKEAIEAAILARVAEVGETLRSASKVTH